MIRDWLIAAGLFLLALSQNLGAVESAPFHPDETRWLNRAHYVRDVTDPFGPTWQDDYLTRGQPPLGSYLMGLGLLAQGRDLETNGVWSFWHDASWNRDHGNMASPDDLRAGRRTNAVIAALAVVVVYLAGRHLTNRVGAVAGALLLAFHPLQIRLGSQALSDALLVLLLAVAVWAGVRLAMRPGWPGAWALAVALGLGAATKLSPLLVAPLLAGVGGGLLILARCSGGWPGRTAPRRRSNEFGAQRHEVLSGLRTEGRLEKAAQLQIFGGWRSGRRGNLPDDARLGWSLLALPVMSFAVFVAAYPYLWPDPLRRTIGLFHFRAEEMARQGQNWSGVAVDSRAEALLRLGDRLGSEYTALGQAADWLRGADLVLGLAGLVVLAGLAVAARTGDRRHLIVLAILGSETALIVLGLRSDYARYALPVVLALAFGVSVLAGWSWSVAASGAARLQPELRRWWRRLVAAPAFSPLAWTVTGAGVVVALLGAGSVLGDDLPEIVARPATPRPAATPFSGTPLAGTPLASPPGATPLPGVPLATPQGATPVASPVEPRATPV